MKGYTVPVTIIRLSSLQTILGLSRSSIYNQISLGILPKPISIGVRAVGWLDYEITEIIDARINGASEHIIKELVKSFYVSRPYRSQLISPNQRKSPASNRLTKFA